MLSSPSDLFFKMHGWEEGFVLIKEVWRYKENALYCIGILAILSVFILFYSGAKEGYFEIFLLASIMAPMLVIVKPKNSLRVDVTFAVLIVLIIVAYALGFWKYKDRPPLPIVDITQVPEELRGGWFSFENPLRLQLIFVCSIISILISLLIRAIFRKFKILKPYKY